MNLLAIQELGPTVCANLFLINNGITDPEEQFGIRLTFEGYALCMGFGNPGGPKPWDLETMTYARVFMKWMSNFQKS